MKILCFLCFLFSCRQTAPVIVRDYAPAQVVINDTTTAPQTIIVGKCTTVIERNNIEKFTTVTTRSAKDTFFQIAPTPEKKEEKEENNFFDFLRYMIIFLAAIFCTGVIVSLFKLIKK